MPDRPSLLLIAGPIAAGKSTVARRLATALRETGETVAVVGLDELAEMALPTLPDWDWAHRVHARTVRAWLDAPLTAVIAEGPGTVEEIELFLAAQPSGVVPYVVLLTCDFPTALARAQADPTRGVSREPTFLRQVYMRFEAERPLLRPHLTLDTAGDTGAGLVARILDHLRRRGQNLM